MWIDVPCPECGGKGDRQGIASHDERGNYFEGLIQCFRCNGERLEAVWVDPCQHCDQTGTEPGTYGARPCVVCFGKGFHSVGPSPRLTRLSIGDDGWKEL